MTSSLPAVSSMFDLTGKLAVVTGASRGIGFAMASALAAAGADIVGVSATLPSSGSEIEQTVEAAGRNFEGYAVDFADADAVQAFADDVTNWSRPVDILVNNAGTIRRASALDHSDADFDHVIAVNLRSQFFLAREFGRGMVTRGTGKIIFTASMLSFQGGINVVGYTAAKSAIAGVTRALANEWASVGVNVNAIAPGYFATDNTEALRDDPVRSAAILSRIPAARWGDAAELGGAVVFLASAASDYVHGTVLAVDGGWLGR